jgi:serine/threonine protein kinase
MGSGGRPLWPGRDIEDQLTRICSVLGTPSEKTWPGVTKLPKYIKLPVYPATPLELVLPSLSNAGLDLLKKHLACIPNLRLSAEKALQHCYFDDVSPTVKELPD